MKRTPFTVKDLIEQLSKMDPERIVVIQDDAEGNGYRLARGADDNAAYTAISGWHGVVGMQSLDDEDRATGFGDEDLAPPGAVPCVVIFPVN